jgi:hypothetical protein
MSTSAISSYFDITPRYLRSTNLERDFHDRRALESYVLTTHAHECLDRLAKGVRPGSTQRAWRVTGNYGSGKSSFALFLAHWFNGDAGRLSKAVNVDVQYNKFALGTKPRYLPLLITGAREPMGRAIVRSLANLLDEQYSRGAKSALQVRLRAAETSGRLTDSDVLEMLSEANEKLVRDDKSSGLLILLDELGKFLEFAAQNPQQQDIFLLQRLAEVACASSKSAPIFVVGMLHQGFDVYAESLEPGTQREWEKVAGRFEEVVFNQPLIQVSELVAAALRVNVQRLPAIAKQEARSGWEAATSMGWLAAGQGSTNAHSELASRLYPLHATVLPAMVRTFARFGQNERSLFGLLLSDEPFGLMSHARALVSAGSTYRLPQFYDYVRSSFGYRLSTQSYRSHWTQIESMVESFSTGNHIELSVVKAVGVLNLLDHPDLVASEKTLQAALGGVGGFDTIELRDAIDRLHKQRKVLFRRGTSGGFCLWPHTSVDLESAYERATKAIGSINTVANHLSDFLENRSLVARRHYIETGNLRFFGVRYLEVSNVDSALKERTAADGMVLVLLCESQAEIDRAEKIARSSELKLRADLMLAIPVEPLSHQAGLVGEVLRWEWVSLNTPELNADRFAREEVSKQLQAARLRLENRIQDLVGLRSLSGARSLRWFVGGAVQKIKDGRQLLQRLSELCDDRYPSAPLVKNELLNRHELSSAAARARMLLVGGVLQRAELPLLGMDGTRKPPEMSMYMSVLARGGLHVKAGERHQIKVPTEAKDALRLRPSFDALRSFLESRMDQRVKATELLDVLRRPPYGVREGLAWLLVATFAAINAQELAFYEDGSFLREIGPDEFQRLTKVPESFEIQLCRIAGVRAEVFEFLLKVLNLSTKTAPEPMVLDVVRPLCQFVAALPDYARNTKRMSAESIKAREIILAAKDPVKLLFRDLPDSIGVQAVNLNSSAHGEKPRLYAKALKKHLDELRHAYDELLGRLTMMLADEFGISGDLPSIRGALAKRAEPLVLSAGEPKLKTLCLRFSDAGLADKAWLESLGSFLTSQPPTRWRDADEDSFRRELNLLAQRFKNLESISFEKGRNSRAAATYKVTVTRSDGHESQEVVFVDPSRATDVTKLVVEIEKVLGKNRSVALAALSQVTWAALEKKGSQ